MSLPVRAVATRELEHHSPLARAVLIGLGLVFALCFGALALLVLSSLSAERWPLLLLAAFLCCPGAYGGWLCWRGLRGYSVRRLERAQAYYDRYALALSLPAGLVLFALLRPASFTASWFLLTGLFVLPVQLVLHELSHVLAGHLVGFRFQSMGIGPFVIHRAEGALTVSWTRLSMHSGVDGWAMVQLRERRRPRLRMAFFAAGGPLGNLVTAALVLFVQWGLGHPVGEGQTVASSVLDALFVWGLIAGLGNLIPMKLPGASLASDGLVLVRLAIEGARAAARRG